VEGKKEPKQGLTALNITGWLKHMFLRTRLAFVVLIVSSASATIMIEDRGKGIPKEQINRIFEPFFTTKPIGKGPGLGLSVSLGTIQMHEGTIEIESEEGKGTTVTLLLPRSGEAHP